MKKLMHKITDMLADAALLEMGVMNVHSPETRKLAFADALEESMIEIAYAEAADFDEIHKALTLEHDEISGAAHPDECQYGDNEMCFRHAA